MPVRQRVDKDGKPIRNTWDLVINLPRERGAKRRRKGYVFRGTKRDAEIERKRLQAIADQGKIPAGRMTVNDLFERYLEEHVRLKLAPHTYVTYRMALTVHGSRLRAVPLGKLARHHLTEHEAYLATEARDRRVTTKKDRLAPSTVARYLNPVKSALEWAESVDLLPRNPARGWKIAQTPPPERPHFDQAQARRFVEAVARSAWAPHLLTLAATGLRLSELRGLRWRDVDLDAGTYQIHQQWQTVMVHTPQADGTSRWKATDVRRPAPKSHRGIRGGGIPAAVCVLLAQWKREQDDRRRFTRRTWRDPEGGALVFADDVGQPFRVGTLRTHFYRLCARHHLPRLSLHDLRHTWVTLQLEAGTAEHLVPQLAGHSPRVEALVYRHSTAAAGRAAAERLWGFVTQATENPPDRAQYRAQPGAD